MEDYDKEHVNDLWEDMDRLNSLYEEMMWEHDDVLEFLPDYKNNQIIIKNKSLDSKYLNSLLHSRNEFYGLFKDRLSLLRKDCRCARISKVIAQNLYS